LASIYNLLQDCLRVLKLEFNLFELLLISNVERMLFLKATGDADRGVEAVGRVGFYKKLSQNF